MIKEHIKNICLNCKNPVKIYTINEIIETSYCNRCEIEVCYYNDNKTINKLVFGCVNNFEINFNGEIRIRREYFNLNKKISSFEEAYNSFIEFINYKYGIPELVDCPKCNNKLDLETNICINIYDNLICKKCLIKFLFEKANKNFLSLVISENKNVNYSLSDDGVAKVIFADNKRINIANINKNINYLEAYNILNKIINNKEFC